MSQETAQAAGPPAPSPPAHRAPRWTWRQCDVCGSFDVVALLVRRHSICAGCRRWSLGVLRLRIARDEEDIWR